MCLQSVRTREHQVDDLGNLDNEPQALFDILGDEVATLQGFDTERLRQARLSRSDRAESARALLDALGWNRLPSDTADALRVALDDLEEREHYEAWGLFVNRSAAEGWALGIQLVPRESGQETLWSEADQAVQEQARIALRTGLPGQGWEARIEWPATYVGESVGLPLYVAGLVVRGDLMRHSLTGATGRLDIGGRVTGVSGIEEKIAAARCIGMRRVLVPRENYDEAVAVAAGELVVVAIAHVSEVASAFRQSATSVDLGYAGLIRLVRASVPDYGLVVSKEVSEPSGHRFVVASTQGTASIWVHTNGRVRSDGSGGGAREAADRLIAERTPSTPEQRDTLSFQLPTYQLQERYQAALQDLGAAMETPHDHETWRMRLARGRSRATVVLYGSGKCVVQGTAPAWDEIHAAASQITQTIGGLLKPKETSTLSPPGGAESSGDDSEPHIGTDEAGKGDYFGPLVSAAVYVDGEVATKLRQLGVRDSKTLSDKRVRALAKEIRELADGKFVVTPINPRKYNELYEQFRREGKNLNSLLAWGHGRSIDNLLNASSDKRVPAKYVIVDQFADKHYIEQRTKRAGIPIRQRHKAEADIAVAAASVLARDGFLQWLERMSERTQIPLPKGASPQVIEAAKQFVRRWGAKWLGEVAKLSFRTTKQVLEGESIIADKRPPQWPDEAADDTHEG